ncbi:cytochrome P450 4V2-like [Dreissena polymorpha]|uniref:cytochrome P450 4V2-like n=1 Tax=Dreissena polymorpha TaxID=45954 RepID=UPI0022645B32|nr:cytochrome P450 4V2-like [Dreissena polymorpha]
MRGLADGKTTVNVFNDITLCALDIICETAMGRSVNAQLNSDSDYVQAVYRASEYTFIRQRSPWLWPDFLFRLIGPGKKYDESLNILHSFTEKVIKERHMSSGRGMTKTKITMEQMLSEQDSAGDRNSDWPSGHAVCTSSEGSDSHSSTSERSGYIHV